MCLWMMALRNVDWTKHRRRLSILHEEKNNIQQLFHAEQIVVLMIHYHGGHSDELCMREE
jgi:hypothetical protein